MCQNIAIFEKVLYDGHAVAAVAAVDLNTAKKSLKKLQSTIDEAQITGQKDEGYSEWLEKQIGKYKEYDASINGIDLKIDIEPNNLIYEMKGGNKFEEEKNVRNNAIKRIAHQRNILLDGINSAGYTPGEDIFLGLDAASTEFYKQDKYILNDKNTLDSSSFCERSK